MFTHIERARDVIRTLAILGALLICTACGSGEMNIGTDDSDRRTRVEDRTTVTGDDVGMDAGQDGRPTCNSERDRHRCDAPDVGPDTSDDHPDAARDGGGETLADAAEDTVDQTPVCGDGLVEGDEQCDDNNRELEACPYGESSCTVCGPDCTEVPGTVAFCGDDTVQSAHGEECDDGNTTREQCAYGQTSCTVCGPDCKNVGGHTRYCGDGVIQSGQGEECDDSGTAAGDGCSANCKVESGYACSGSPSVCTPAPSPGTGDAQCEPTYGSGVYDAFPWNNSSYPKGNSDTYGWPGDDFESYAHDEIVETSTNKSRRSHLDVTSGTLRAKHLNGSQLWKRGWTNTHNFRVLSRTTSGGDLVRLTDVEPAVRVYISSWDSSGPQWSGAHIFARYQTENDLYVASLRKDGKVYIKLKHCDAYTTLAGANFSQGAVQTGKWYDLRFEVVGQRLRFYVDGTLELEAFDDTLSWGTTGVRTDYSTMYIDDWEHR
jgi:cysteine-rich repeat protein